MPFARKRSIITTSRPKARVARRDFARKQQFHFATNRTFRLMITNNLSPSIGALESIVSTTPDRNIIRLEILTRAGK